MTSPTLLSTFASSLSAVPVPDAGVASAAAVLLCDHLVLLHGAGPGAEPGDAVAAAVAASVGDADDVHWGALVHPGAIVWPVVLEVARARGASGAQALRAASIGYEAMVRLARATGVVAGFHLTSVVGGAAAAAAASALLDDAGEVSADALGHALSVAGGSSGALLERSGTRAFHRGHAVRTGLAAARAAADGLRATQQDLERGGGALPALGVEAFAPAAPAGDALLTASVRPLATSGWNHPVYEAARDAARSLGEDVEQIAVTVPAAVVKLSSERTEPESEAWHDIRQSVARAIASVHAGQSIAELRARVTVDERETPGAAVQLRSTSGRGADAEVLLPLGHPERPVTRADLAAKWGLDDRRTAAALGALAAWLTDPDPRPCPDPLTPKEH